MAPVIYNLVQLRSDKDKKLRPDFSIATSFKNASVCSIGDCKESRLDQKQWPELNGYMCGMSKRRSRNLGIFYVYTG